MRSSISGLEHGKPKFTICDNPVCKRLFYNWSWSYDSLVPFIDTDILKYLPCKFESILKSLDHSILFEQGFWSFSTSLYEKRKSFFIIFKSLKISNVCFHEMIIWIFLSRANFLQKKSKNCFRNLQKKKITVLCKSHLLFNHTFMSDNQVHYSFIEKFFKIHPENTIGRTSYTVRILLIWFIFYFGMGVIPVGIAKMDPLLLLSVGIIPFQLFVYI